MSFIFILIGINTLLVFLFKREWLLSKNTFIVLLLTNIFFFIIGYIFELKKIGNPKMVVALKMPIMSQIIFLILCIIFRKLYKRDPLDTFWSMNRNLMKDGLFNFLFWLLGGLLPFFIVMHK